MYRRTTFWLFKICPPTDGYYILNIRFGASPSPCRRVGKPSEKGLGTKWLKCVGPLGSITAAEKHSNTKHWLNNMVIIPIEVFRKYLYNFGVWIECSTQVFYSYKPKSLNSIVVRTQEHIGRGFLLDITLITTFPVRPSKIIARSRIKYTVVPSTCVLHVLGHVWGHFQGVWGKQRRHGGEGECDMIDMFRRIWHCRLTCGLVCPLFRSI